MLLKELLENINAMPLPKDLEKKSKKIKNRRDMEGFLDDIHGKHKRLGAGSSRSVYSIEDPSVKVSRPLATKFANDWERGPAQNKAESRRKKGLKKYMDIKKRGDIRILIPLVDYDKSSSKMWVQHREAEKFNSKKFYDFVGLRFDDYSTIMRELMENFSRYFVRSGKKVYLKDIKTWLRKETFVRKGSMAEKFIIQCVKLAREFKVNFGDLTNPNYQTDDEWSGDTSRNWGIYKNKPVIIDYGFNREVQQKHY